MNIVQLPIGDAAPKDSDCISIQQTGPSVFELDTSTLTARSGGEDSEAVIGSEPYDTYEEAEAAGLAIAAENGVERVYISRENYDH